MLLEIHGVHLLTSVKSQKKKPNSELCNGCQQEEMGPDDSRHWILPGISVNLTHSSFHSYWLKLSGYWELCHQWKRQKVRRPSTLNVHKGV